MDRPFREVHELYRILYLRAEAQAAAEKARKEQEEKERKNNEKRSGQKPPIDARGSNTSTIEPSPLELSVLEDAIEDLI